MVYEQKLDVTAFDFTALNKSKSEADAIKKQTEALAKDYDHLLQNQKKLQVIISKTIYQLALLKLVMTKYVVERTNDTITHLFP